MKESQRRSLKKEGASTTARSAESVGMGSDASASLAAKKGLAIAVERRRPTAQEGRRFEQALQRFLTELIRQQLQRVREKKP